MAPTVPGLDDLGPSDLGRARIVVLHRPSLVGGRTTWQLSLVDLTGRVVARETVTESGAGSLHQVVGPSLDRIGRRVDGAWISDRDEHGDPRHRALLA